jgi:hypothetical protein
MGMATYYLKASFDSKAGAAAGLEAMRRLLLEGARAEDYWQENRDKKPSEFWPEFQAKFPAVWGYLDPKVRGGDCNNGLAGELDFGSEEDAQNNLESDGLRLRYSAYVWHCASWDRLVAYAKSVCGAAAAGWISEEDVEPDCFGAIEMG